MQWIEAKIYTTTAGIEPVTGNLLALGINGFAIEDAKDFTEFLNQTTPNWDYVDESLMELEHCETNIKIYLPDTAEGLETLGQVRTELKRLKQEDEGGYFGRLEIGLENLNEEDWATAWKKYYHPVRVGKKLVVCPSWEEYKKTSEDILITLDPGMAFGTGTHHTTRLCMELLEQYVTAGKSVLDIGCGSGILAITSVLLGANGAIGCDIDETAVKVARENAQLNGVEGRVQFHQGDLAAKVSGQYDIICANIVADVIIRLAPEAKRYLKPDGVFICSGIIDSRKEDVEAALKENGFQKIDCREDGGWVAIANRIAQ